MRQTLHSIFMVLTLRCEEAEIVRLRAGHGEAGRLEKLADALHRLICKPCRHAAVQQAKLDAVLRQRPTSPEDEFRI